MAKVVSDEILKLKIVVNGDEAQKRILDLEMANKKVSNSIDEQRAKLRQLSYNRTKNKEEIEQTKAAITKLTAEYDNNLRRIDQEIRSMDHLSLTTQQLKRRMDELAFTMRHMNPNDPNYKLAQQELDKLDSRYRQLRSGMSETAFSFKEMSDKINQYSALITMAIIAITTMVIAIRDAIDVNNKLADAQSAVSKTTGLTIEQVRELSEALKELDTRTSQLDLLKIAEIGGRLGVAQNEIKDFTREVDKIYVALGDGFAGGVEKVAESLGKLKGLYSETRDLPIAEAMNQIGSAINELGAAGAASEENIAEFGLRVGSLPEALKPSISEALALGAAFEESGIDAERSGTAYSAFVRTAAKSADKFAQVMGKTKEEVEGLINTDPLEFFLQFAEGAKGLEATELSAILDGLKLNDQYVIAIMGAASENANRFRESIALSNEELKKATSLQIEFDKVNNNAAAIYDKIAKKFNEMYTSDAVASTLSWLVEKFGQLIGAVKDTDGTMTRIRETIIFLTKIFLIGLTAVASYNTAILLTSKVFTLATGRVIGFTIAQKAHNVITTISTFLFNLYTASIARVQLGYAVLTGRTALQTAAQAKLNAVTLANPFGALIAVVLAAAAAVYLFSENTDEAARKQKEMNDLRTEAAKKVLQEKTELANLLAVARNENLAKEDRLRAIKRLNEIAPQYLGNLTLENLKTAEGTALINNYIKALDRKAMAEVLSNKRTQLMGKQLDIQSEEIKPWGGDVATWMENKINTGNRKRTMSLSESRDLDLIANVAEVEKKLATYVPAVASAYRKRREELRANYKQMQVLNEEQKKYINANPSDFIDANSGSDYVPLGKKEGSSAKTGKSAGEKKANAERKKYETERDKILESAENYNQRMMELEAEQQRAMAELQQDGYDKERAILLAEQDKTMAALEKKKYSDQEMEKIRSMIAKEQGDMKIRLQEIEFQWLEENARISSLQELEVEKNNLKLLALREKYLTQSYKKDEEALDARLKLIDREKNEKLALETLSGQKDFLRSQGYTEENLQYIKSWEEGRKEIEKFYLNQRLTEQVAFLKKKVAEFNVLSQINPLSLTPEQLDIIEEYKNKIAELGAELAKLKNGGSDNSLEGSVDKGKESFESRGTATDILGMTPDEWNAMFENTDNMAQAIGKITAALQIAKQMFASYFEFVEANERRQLQNFQQASDRKKKKLQMELDSGRINQETFKKETIKMDEELEKKKAELAMKRAKRERAMKIVEIITNTSVAIMQALAQLGPIAGIVASVLVGTMGAIQLATVMRTPLPTAEGAEEGLYPVVREQDGKIFSARRKRSRSGVYSEPTLLVGEAGASMPELVVSGRDLKRVDPDITRMFMRDIDRVRGYENGMYPTTTGSESSGASDELMIRMMALLKENTEVMSEIRRYGITAIIDKNARNGKEFKETIGLFENLDTKNKH